MILGITLINDVAIFYLMIGIPVALILLLNWACAKRCAACGEIISDKYSIGVGSPANVSLHDRKSCRDKWDNEMVNSEPYASRSREYIRLLDRKRAGEKISPEEWKSCYR